MLQIKTKFNNWAYGKGLFYEKNLVIFKGVQKRK